MKRILIIQSRVRPEMVAGEQKEYTRAIGNTAEISFVSAVEGIVPWLNPEEILKDYDAVIFGGSGDFDFDGGREQTDPARTTAHMIRERVTPLVKLCIDKNIPLLGICFGHQIVGEVFGTKVHNDPLQKKVGTHQVSLTAEGRKDPLFGTLPETFNAQYGHKDSLSGVPTGATLLAIGKDCRYSALRYGEKAYTVQFHPELTAADVGWKLAHSPGYLPEGVAIESLVKESPESSTLIPSFIEKIV